MRLDPSSLRPVIGLADVARHLNELDSAELLYRQILARNPKYIRAYTGLVEVLRTRNNWAEAAKWQAKRLDVESHNDAESQSGVASRSVAGASGADPEETAKLGEFLLKAGEPDLAEKTFLATLEREPYSNAAHRHLADLYSDRAKLSHDRGDSAAERDAWVNARAHLEFVIRYEPDSDPVAYTALADVYRALGRPSAAAAILRKGLRIFPDNATLKTLVNSP
jgi:tetratricopeptide (TPR) repeat protein